MESKTKIFRSRKAAEDAAADVESTGNYGWVGVIGSGRCLQVEMENRTATQRHIYTLGTDGYAIPERTVEL